MLFENIFSIEFLLKVSLESPISRSLGALRGPHALVMAYLMPIGWLKLTKKDHGRLTALALDLHLTVVGMSYVYRVYIIYTLVYI